jgi:hypothetical protein
MLGVRLLRSIHIMTRQVSHFATHKCQPIVNTTAFLSLFMKPTLALNGKKSLIADGRRAPVACD